MVLRDHKLSVAFDEKKVDAIFAELDRGSLPGAAVGIAIDGQPVYRKGFGLACLDLPVTLSPTIRIRIGSVSKQFAAFAYMMLCEEGKAGIDDPIGKHLPELHPVTHPVTMRQLMGNNSGLRDATDLIFQFSDAQGRRLSTEDILSLYRESCDSSAPPGTVHLYNNGGWIILSTIIERIAGQPLEQVLRDRVFLPIGMRDTLLRRWDAEYIGNSASTHAFNESGGYERVEIVGGLDYVGAGSISSTVDDMLRWMAHMDRPTVGSAATWAAMKTSQTLSNGTPTDYGLGLACYRHRGLDVLEHGGGGHGSNTMLKKVPAAGLDIIVMVNRSDKSSLEYTEEILEVCLPGREAAPLSYSGPSPQGVFRSPTTGRMVQLLRTDVIYHRRGEEVPTAAVDGHFMPIAPDGQGVWRPLDASFGFSITPSSRESSPPSIKLEELGCRDELIAVKPADAGHSRAVEGRYRNAETRTEVVIAQRDSELIMEAFGRFGSTRHSLECLAQGIWRNRVLNRWIVPPWGLLSFDSDGSAFGFYNYLTRNLRFRRIG